MDNLIIRAKVASRGLADTVKEKARKFFTEEKGGGEIVGAIVVIAIVVLLAVAFKGQLETLMGNVWSSISGQETNITTEMNIGNGGSKDQNKGNDNNN